MKKLKTNKLELTTARVRVLQHDQLTLVGGGGNNFGALDQFHANFDRSNKKTN